MAVLTGLNDHPRLWRIPALGIVALLVTLIAFAVGTPGSLSAQGGQPPEERSVGVAQVGVGRDHACALLTDGSIDCWGSNEDRRGSDPRGEYTQLSVRGSGNCAVSAAQDVVCWGGNGYASPQVGSFTSVSTGWDHACAVRQSGAVHCWGANGNGQSSPPPGRFAAVAVGSGFSCGIRDTGRVACWGGTARLGTMPDERFTSLTAGHAHACGITSEQDLSCWGLYPGETPIGKYVSVDAALLHTCAAKSSGALTCWTNPYPTDGYLWHESTLQPPSGVYQAVSTDLLSGCAITMQDRLVCWGHQYSRQDEAPTGQFRDLAASWEMTCAIQTNGEVKCWGDVPPEWGRDSEGPYRDISIQGQVICAIVLDGSIDCWGRGTYGRPVEPSGSFRSISISAGIFASCALTQNGAALCWDAGELLAVSSQTVNSYTGPFRAIDSGYADLCAITRDGRLRCFNTHIYAPSSLPSYIPSSLYSAQSVSVGRSHACVVLANQDVGCFGSNWHGESNPPDDHFHSVAAGNGFTCGLLQTGDLKCWGYEYELGEQPPAGSFTAVEAGRAHACALSDSGQVQCWLIRRDVLDVPTLLLDRTALHATGRLAARRLANGQVEFAFDPDRGDRILPTSRFLPPSAATGRWFNSSVVSTDDGREIGKISVRKLEDGRIEFGFLPSGGTERVLPRSRLFPANAGDRWLRTAEFSVVPQLSQQ